MSPTWTETCPLYKQSWAPIIIQLRLKLFRFHCLVHDPPSESVGSQTFINRFPGRPIFEGRRGNDLIKTAQLLSVRTGKTQPLLTVNAYKFLLRVSEYIWHRFPLAQTQRVGGSLILFQKNKKYSKFRLQKFSLRSLWSQLTDWIQIQTKWN